MMVGNISKGGFGFILAGEYYDIMSAHQTKIVKGK
jgi:hypothetical protein